MAETETQSSHDWDKVRDAELENVRRVVAARIAGELELSTVTEVAAAGGEYKVKLEVDGGFHAFGSGSSKFAITSVLGNGNDPDTITLYVVEKNY